MMTYATHNDKKCDTRKPYVFISYSSGNKEIVHKDVEELRKRGVNIWIDTAMRTGKTWKEEAFKALENYYCKAIMFYASEHSLASPNVFEELQHSHFEKMKALHGTSKIPILSIQLMDFGKHGDLNSWHSKYLVKSIYDKFGDIDEDDSIKKRDAALEAALKIIEEYLMNGEVIIHQGFVEHDKEYYDSLMPRFEYYSVINNPPEGDNQVQKRSISEHNEPIVTKAVKSVATPREVFTTTPLIESPDVTQNIGKQDTDEEILEQVEHIDPTAVDDNGLINFTLYDKRYQSFKQVDFMAQVYEEVLNKNDKKLDIVVAKQQNVAFSHQSQKLQQSYFNQKREILVLGKKVWIGTSYAKKPKLRQIAQLFSILDINPDDILQIEKETLPKIRQSDSGNGAEQSTNNGSFNFKLFDQQFSADNQSEFMFLIYEELLRRYPEQINEVIQKQNHVIIEDEEKAASISYFRVSKVMNIAGQNIRVGASLSFKDKLRHTRNLFNILAVSYSVYESEDVQIS